MRVFSHESFIVLGCLCFAFVISILFISAFFLRFHFFRVRKTGIEIKCQRSFIVNLKILNINDHLSKVDLILVEPNIRDNVKAVWDSICIFSHRVRLDRDSFLDLIPHRLKLVLSGILSLWKQHIDKSLVNWKLHL